MQLFQGNQRGHRFITLQIPLHPIAQRVEARWATVTNQIFYFGDERFAAFPRQSTIKPFDGRAHVFNAAIKCRTTFLIKGGHNLVISAGERSFTHLNKPVAFGCLLQTLDRLQADI
ncbi:hypothetical protein D3C76_1222890 [compost metagenome]